MSPEETIDGVELLVSERQQQCVRASQEQMARCNAQHAFGEVHADNARRRRGLEDGSRQFAGAGADVEDGRY